MFYENKKIFYKDVDFDEKTNIRTYTGKVGHIGYLVDYDKQFSLRKGKLKSIKIEEHAENMIVTNEEYSAKEYSTPNSYERSTEYTRIVEPQAKIRSVSERKKLITPGTYRNQKLIGDGKLQVIKNNLPRKVSINEPFINKKNRTFATSSRYKSNISKNANIRYIKNEKYPQVHSKFLKPTMQQKTKSRNNTLLNKNKLVLKKKKANEKSRPYSFYRALCYGVERKRKKVKFSIKKRKLYSARKSISSFVKRKASISL
jgi:hypothetical protein